MIVDDNFVNKRLLKKSQDFFFGANSEFSWYFHENTTLEADDVHVLKSKSTEESLLFSSSIEEGSEAYNIVHEIFTRFLINNSKSCSRILRIKANLYTQGVSANHHSPHIDLDIPHKVFLYYIDDSDGYTWLFNERFSGERVSNLTVSDRIEPKAGRGILFDGFQYHASSSPVYHKKRCTINIDFI